MRNNKTNIDMKFTRQSLLSLNNIHSIPKYVGINKNVILDPFLFNALSTSPDPDRDKIYDFEVFLPSYGINLQRPYVWGHTQQNEFILSILLEKPIQPIVVVQHEFKVNKVIDGKQRLMTIKKFLANEFPVILNGTPAYFKDFAQDLRILFNRLVDNLTAIVYYSYDDQPVTDDMLIVLFNFYNFAGTPQTQEHKDKLQALLNK